MTPNTTAVIAIVAAVGLLGGLGAYVLLNGDGDSEGYSMEEIDSIEGLTVTYVSGTDATWKYYSISNGEYAVVFSNLAEDSEYSITGSLTGYVSADAGDHNITLQLSGLNVASEYFSPIQVTACDSAFVNSVLETTNTVEDFRETGDGYQSAVYCAGNLYLNGSGSLKVTSSHRDGISAGGCVYIEDVIMDVDSVGCSVTAGKGVEMTSGNVYLRSHEGNGITAQADGTVLGGTQYGEVEINTDNGDSTLTIYAQRDGIDAAYRVKLLETYGTLTLNISTSDMSQPQNTQVVYVGYSNDDFRFSLEATMKDGTTQVYNPSGDPNHVVPALSTSYVYQFSLPEQAESFVIYAYEYGQIQGQTDDYYARSDSIELGEYNAYLVTQCAENMTIMYKEKKYDGPPSPDFDSIANSAIRACDTVQIEGGTVVLRSNSDTIVAGYGEALASTGAAGSGTVTVDSCVTAFSRASCIRSSGSVSVNGGQSVLYSTGGNGAAIDAQNGYVFNGGQVLALSSDSEQAQERMRDCDTFDSVATSVSLTEAASGSYIEVTVSEATAVVATVPDMDSGRPPEGPGGNGPPQGEMQNSNAGHPGDGGQPFSSGLFVVYLGSSAATINNTTTTAQDLDENGIYWA